MTNFQSSFTKIKNYKCPNKISKNNDNYKIRINHLDVRKLTIKIKMR
jgi:hypothetical protein